MSGKRRKSGGGQQSDFKRLKAKVGKKAPKPQNLTDTSFKAASLHVAGQAAVADRGDNDSSFGDALVSSRGRTLVELISQLGHPASAVRHSAMKGLENVASQQSTITLKPHLSHLLDSCAKSWVDESEDVRNTGLSLFENLIPRFEAGTIAPFAPLICAYINSALHSLDQQMRVDGSRAITILSKCHPSLVEPFLGKFITAYSRLLAERKVAKTSEGILQGLVSLLRCSKKSVKSGGGGSTTTIHNLGIPDPDLIYFRGGRSRNALTLTITKPVRNETLMSFQTVSDMCNTNQVPGSSDGKDGSSSTDYTKDLLVQLRNLLVEVIQESELPFDQQSGKRKATTNEDRRIILLVEAVRLVWKTSKIEIEPSSSTDTETEKTKKDEILRLSEQIISILLEWLPDNENMTIDDEQDKHVLITSICDTVLEVSSSLASSSSNKKSLKKMGWILPVHRYLLARVDAKAAKSEVIDVLCRFVLFLDETRQYNNLLLSVLKRLQELYFVEDQCTEVVMRSEPARKIVLLMDGIVRQHQYALENNKESPLNEILIDIVKRFPHYLQAWGANYSYESEAVLNSLTEITRRSYDHTSSDLLSSFRSDLRGSFVIPPSESTTKPKGRSAASVFEQVTPRLQRLYLRLLVLLESPPSESLKSLSALCASSVHSPGRVDDDIRHEIVVSIQSIRKSFPMRDYLGFLVSTIGIPDKGRKNKKSNQGETTKSIDSKKVLALDSGLEDFVVCLLRCGPSGRTFQMLLPQFVNWLESCSDPVDSVLRYRSCTAIIAILVHDMKVRNDSSSDLAEISPDIIDPLVAACTQVILACSFSEIEMECTPHKILSPFVSLLRLEPKLLPLVFTYLEKSRKKDGVRLNWEDSLEKFSTLLQDSNVTESDLSGSLLALFVKR